MPQVSDIVIIVTSLQWETRVEVHQDCKDLLLVNLTPDNNRKKRILIPSFNIIGIVLKARRGRIKIKTNYKCVMCIFPIS